MSRFARVSFIPFILLTVSLVVYQNCSDAEFDFSAMGTVGSLSLIDADGDGLIADEEAEFGTDPDKFDSDGDGLSDGAEVNTHGTDPNNPDTDNGGTSDGDEVKNGTNPKDNPADDKPDEPVDSDKDGLTDAKEIEIGTDPNNPDTDGDDLTDGSEVNTHGTDPLDKDTDDGGMPDGVEVSSGKNPRDNPADDSEEKDTDFDGLIDSVEDVIGTDPTNPDTDNDGLSDGAEVFVHQTNPLVADTDEGGVNDGDEVNQGSNPRNNPKDDKPYEPVDSDKDGLTDAKEIEIGTDPNNPDTDGDGLKDGAEVNTYNTDPLNPDTDNGGMKDGPEISMGKDPLDPSDDSSMKDLDEDGLTDSQEKHIGTDPNNPDTDSDGLKDGPEVLTYMTDPLRKDTDNGGVDDGYEVNVGMNPLDPVDDKTLLDSDPDQDGLSTRREIKIGTDPMDPDSDGDQLKDGAEVKTYGTNPLDPDTDNGGIEDGREIMVGKDPLDPKDDILSNGENCQITNDLGVWHDPMNKRNLSKAKYLGPIKAFSGNQTGAANYNYNSWSVHPNSGPQPETGVFKVALYKGVDGLSLMFFSNKDNARDKEWKHLNFDLTIKRNGKKDELMLSDDRGEVKMISSDSAHKVYQARLRYTKNSDGGVVGPLVRKRFMSHFNMIKTDEIEAIHIASEDGTVYKLPAGADSHFMLGYRRVIHCDMANNQNKIQLLRFPNKVSRKSAGAFLFKLQKELKDDDQLICKIDGKKVFPCTPGVKLPFSGLGLGNHQLQVDLISGDQVRDSSVYKWQIIKRNLVRRCLNLNKRKTQEYEVQFPQTSQSCKWGDRDNLAKRNGYLQAIQTQVQKLDLPKNAKVCNVNFDFPEETQNFKYDDIFYLKLNGVVLASNGLFSLTQTGDGNMGFNWSEAKGLKFPSQFNSRTDQNYCFGEALGKGQCEWPQTQKQGPIKLTYNPDLIEKISSQSNQLEVIVAGDDDASDCQHTGLSFKVSVDYVN